MGMSESSQFEAIAAGATELRVRLGRGQIHARAGGDVDWWLGWSADDGQPPRIRRDGHVLCIDCPVDDASPDEAHLETSLDIAMPLSVESVDLRTDQGDVRADGLVGRVVLHSGDGDVRLRRARGQARVFTGGGDVHLEDLEGGVVAHTGHGDLRLSGWRGGPSTGAELHTGAGDVEVRGTGGELDIQSGAGRVDVRVEGGFGLEVVTGAGGVAVDGGTVRSLRVKTGAGDVNCSALLGPGHHEVSTGTGLVCVTVPAEARARIDAQTGWGRVHSDFPLVRVRPSGRASPGGLRMVGGAGDDDPDTHLQLRTDQGTVRIKRAPALGDTAGGRAAVHARQRSSDAPPASSGAWPMDLRFRLDLSAPGRPVESDALRSAGLADQPTTGAAGRTDPILAILTAVARGEITPDQAEALLGSEG
jgi:hypothetical protein